MATIKVRGADLRFANTHLTSNNNAERLEQAQKVVELLGTSKTPTLLVGDLNATPDAPEIKTLTAVLARHLDRGRSRARATRSRRTTRPTGSTSCCTARACARPRPRCPVTPASDHLPVVASFTLR